MDPVASLVLRQASLALRQLSSALRQRPATPDTAEGDIPRVEPQEGHLALYGPKGGPVWTVAPE